MPYALKGRNVLVAAGSRGLGALIAEKFGAEGCNVAINYSQSKDRAEALAKKIEQEHGVKTVVLKGDMGIQADCRNVVRKSIESLNGLDVIIANAGWTKPCDFGNLGGLTEEEWDKCWAINTKSNLWLISEAESTFKANADGGVFLITSSIAVSPRETRALDIIKPPPLTV
ncbi:hypothetical protein MMC25_005382 [Agyrium rufum]|nr:hypothetical protein [Agyrium rufum]